MSLMSSVNLQIAAAAAVTVAAVAIGVTVYRQSGPEAVGAPPAAQEPAVAQAALPQTGASEEAAQELAAERDAEPQADAPAKAFAKIDVVRVEADGQALIAGEGQAGSALELLLDGVPVSEVTVDAGGAFAAFADLGTSDVPRILSLRDKASGAEPEAQVIIAPVGLAAELAQAADASAEDGVAEEGAVEAGAADVATLEAETPAPAPTPAQTQAPAVIVSDAEGVDVIQSPRPQVMSQVALDAITYSEAGDVALTGRAPEGGFVRVYLDNKPVTTRPVASGGDWRAELPDVDSGIYTLRVDEVDASGAVQSRVETPFKREEPEDVAAAGADVKLVTVQPGATLWAIARDRFGEGTQYVQIYEANKERIGDPDLIFPGQVFDLPE